MFGVLLEDQLGRLQASLVLLVLEAADDGSELRRFFRRQWLGHRDEFVGSSSMESLEVWSVGGSDFDSNCSQSGSDGCLSKSRRAQRKGGCCCSVAWLESQKDKWPLPSWQCTRIWFLCTGEEVEFRPSSTAVSSFGCAFSSELYGCLQCLIGGQKSAQQDWTLPAGLRSWVPPLERGQMPNAPPSRGSKTRDKETAFGGVAVGLIRRKLIRLQGARVDSIQQRDARKRHDWG